MKERSFKKGFKALREKNGYTQKSFAEKHGYNHQTVINWEQGRATPDARVLFQLCDIFQCDMDCLFGTLDYKTHDLEFICRETGLSEASAMLLKSNRSNNLYQYSRIINLLIESPHFDELLNQIGHTLYANEEAQRLCQLREDRLSGIDPEESDEAFERYLDAIFPDKEFASRASQVQDYRCEIALPAEDAVKFYEQCAVDVFRDILKEEIKRRNDEIEAIMNAKH